MAFRRRLRFHWSGRWMMEFQPQPRPFALGFAPRAPKRNRYLSGERARLSCLTPNEECALSIDRLQYQCRAASIGATFKGDLSVVETKSIPLVAGQCGKGMHCDMSHAKGVYSVYCEIDINPISHLVSRLRLSPRYSSLFFRPSDSPSMPATP